MAQSLEVETPAGAWTRRRALVLVWVVFGAHLATAALVVPPWQNPDEPVHFAVIRALTRNAWLDIAHRHNVDVQAEVLRSMAAHDWWSAYQEPVPRPFPQSFADVPTHMGDAALAPPLYYVAMAAYCRALRVFSVESQYYAVRFASVAMTLVTFALILRGARDWFDERVALYAGIVAALVPQFVLIGISVSPDPLLFMVAAFVWWQASRVVLHHRMLIPLAMMIAAALAAVLSKQLAIPLLLQIPVLALVSTLGTRRGRRIAAAAIAVAIALRLLGILHAATFLRADRLIALHRYKSLLGWNDFGATPAYFADFTWRLFESGYLVAGWQRFYGSPVITAVALITLAALFVGGVWAALEQADTRFRLAVVAAVAFCAIQLMAVYGTNYFLPRWGAQGRFLFPAIGPFAALCALTLAHWRTYSPRTLAGVVAVLGVVDLMAWLTVMVPVYARWI